ncbi:hypothetical protein [Micrococcus yunnanensis]|nr:hypothetical protein [Micrococcus yunnanensis]
MALDIRLQDRSDARVRCQHVLSVGLLCQYLAAATVPTRAA